MVNGVEISAADKRAMRERMLNAPLLENKRSRVKACIYGPNGAGKSVWAVGLLRKLLGPDPLIIFVDTNEGYESLRNHPNLMKNVKPIAFESIEQLYVIAEEVFKGEGMFANVGGIVFDDADFMAKEDLNRLWHDRVARNDSKSDPEKPDRPEYLKLGFRFIGVMDFIFKKTPDVHLILVAHEGNKKSEDGKVILNTYPGFNPALSDEIAAKVNLVAYMTAKATRDKATDVVRYERKMQVHPSTLTVAKTRIGCDKMVYGAGELLNHIYDWVMEGRTELSEKEVILREKETSKMLSEIDKERIEVDEDDVPALVE